MAVTLAGFLILLHRFCRWYCSSGRCHLRLKSTTTVMKNSNFFLLHGGCQLCRLSQYKIDLNHGRTYNRGRKKTYRSVDFGRLRSEWVQKRNNCARNAPYIMVVSLLHCIRPAHFVNHKIMFVHCYVPFIWITLNNFHISMTFRNQSIVKTKHFQNKQIPNSYKKQNKQHVLADNKTFANKMKLKVASMCPKYMQIIRILPYTHKYDYMCDIVPLPKWHTHWYTHLLSIDLVENIIIIGHLSKYATI